jgi:hypothetical protein
MTHVEFLKHCAKKTLLVLIQEYKEFQQASTVNQQHQHRSIDYAHILDIRIEEGIVSGDHIQFHRVFAACADSGDASEVGWVITDEVHRCMVCAHVDSLIPSKHHCRACGLLICQHCSLFAEVDIYPGPALSRVCRLCCFDQSPVLAEHNSHLGRSIVQQDQSSNPFPESMSVSDEADQHLTTNLVHHAQQQIEADRVAHVSPPTSKNPDLATLYRLRIIPNPGFVIKTHTLSAETHKDSEKVFINVWQHDDVDEFWKASLTSASHPHNALDNTTDLPLLQFFGEPGTVRDKEGHPALLFHVCIGSSHFLPSPSTDPTIPHPPLITTNIIAQVSSATYRLILHFAHCYSQIDQQIVRQASTHWLVELNEEHISTPHIAEGYKGLPIISPLLFTLLESEKLMFENDRYRNVHVPVYNAQDVPNQIEAHANEPVTELLEQETLQKAPNKTVDPPISPPTIPSPPQKHRKSIVESINQVLHSHSADSSASVELLVPVDNETVVDLPQPSHSEEKTENEQVGKPPQPPHEIISSPSSSPSQTTSSHHKHRTSFIENVKHALHIENSKGVANTTTQSTPAEARSHSQEIKESSPSQARKPSFIHSFKEALHLEKSMSSPAKADSHVISTDKAIFTISDAKEETTIGSPSSVDAASNPSVATRRPSLIQTIRDSFRLKNSDIEPLPVKEIESNPVDFDSNPVEITTDPKLQVSTPNAKPMVVSSAGNAEREGEQLLFQTNKISGVVEKKNLMSLSKAEKQDIQKKCESQPMVLLGCEIRIFNLQDHHQSCKYYLVLFIIDCC